MITEEPGAADGDPMVTLQCGAVRGVQREGSVAFLGIPFAEPPVGPLRFAAPQRVGAWDGVLDATRFGPTPQRHVDGRSTLIPEPSIEGHSSLSVNVVAPSVDPAARLPVLVWIHGGGFVSGSPASPWYDGAAFARDVVLALSSESRQLRVGPRCPRPRVWR